jgi:hypothetical protein
MRCVRTRIVSCCDASADALCPVPCAATFSPRSRAKSTTATDVCDGLRLGHGDRTLVDVEVPGPACLVPGGIALDRDRARELPAQAAEVVSPPVRQVLDIAHHLEAPPFSFRSYE